MLIDKILLGDKAPYEFNVVIEISKGGIPIKYEIDKDSGALIVDRFVNTAMYYPYNYGFLPQTLGEDGDPLDALVLIEEPLMPGCVIKVRPIGVLFMTDESGKDEKILTVPVSKVHKKYDKIKSYNDFDKAEINQIKHFFEHYKDLEEGKWVKVKNFDEKEAAHDLINKSIQALCQKVV